jgi:hypothetical protein
MARQVRIDFRGLGEILTSVEMHREIGQLTDKVAENVRRMGIRVGDRDGRPSEHDLPVLTDVSTTDRAHGIVTLGHASGDAVQAKHGALTKAAAEAGRGR